MATKNITDDLDLFLAILPARIQTSLQKKGNKDNLIEVILDLGRRPSARFNGKEITLGNKEITRQDIDHVQSKIGNFGGDNRAGIERTLHRISAIRNRKGEIIGLTCRVGRAVQGTVDIIRDLIQSDQSILIMGKPGIGKTTMLRETARILADDLDKRVVIVDTSNEIAGDGDIPHPAIGKARRMQVTHPEKQHQVMIEAVENHMPQVIVIDEMGTTLEAEAARTIAERGVQLIATAHGNTLHNLMQNPTLNDLVGGIQSVTLGDDEARRRGTQKSILERKAPPTFDIVVEIINRGDLVIHKDVTASVDAILRNTNTLIEKRSHTQDGSIVQEQQELIPDSYDSKANSIQFHDFIQPYQALPIRIFSFGLSRKFIKSASFNLSLNTTIVQKVEDADIIITLKKYYRKRGKRIREAESQGIPLFVVKDNTLQHAENCLLGLKDLNLSPENKENI